VDRHFLEGKILYEGGGEEGMNRTAHAREDSLLPDELAF
jgi:hypothetical protein